MALNKDCDVSLEASEPDQLHTIHKAILSNDTNSLKRTLKLGFNVNQKFGVGVSGQHAGMTPLGLASALDKPAAAKLLLTYSADVNDTFADLKTTALMTAAFHGHTDAVELLLKNGANVEAVDLQGSTALGYAFGGTKSVKVIDQLLNAGIDVNHRNMLGMNALLLVAGYGNDKLVKMMVDAGGDANSANNFGHTALHLAIAGKRSRLRKLMPGGASSAATCGLNRRDIDVALREWARLHPEAVKRASAPAQDNDAELERVGQFMMMIGSKLDGADTASENDQEAMKRRIEAVWRHRRDKMQQQKDRSKSGILDNILSCGIKRHKQAKTSETPFAKPYIPADQQTSVSAENQREITAVIDQCTNVLRLVVDAGCHIDAMEKTFGLTALDMAILLGDVESTAFLVTAGGDAEHLMKMFASSELYDAIVEVDRKKVKELLAYDADLDVNQPFSKLNVTSKQEHGENEVSGDYKYEGMTPLAVAAQMTVVDVLDIMKLLQKHGANMNKVGPGGSSPLAEASRIGCLKLVHFVLHQGADIEAANPAYLNASAVVVAVMKKHMGIVEYLIEMGAKLDKPLSDGRTSLLKAMETNDRPMVEKLLQANLDRNFADRKGFMYQMAQLYQKRTAGGTESVMQKISQHLEELTSKEKSDKGQGDLLTTGQSEIATTSPVKQKLESSPDDQTTVEKRRRSRGKRSSKLEKGELKADVPVEDVQRSYSLKLEPAGTHLARTHTDVADNFQTGLKRWPVPSVEEQEELIGNVKEANDVFLAEESYNSTKQQQGGSRNDAEEVSSKESSESVEDDSTACQVWPPSEDLQPQVSSSKLESPHSGEELIAGLQPPPVAEAVALDDDTWPSEKSSSLAGKLTASSAYVSMLPSPLSPLKPARATPNTAVPESRVTLSYQDDNSEKLESNEDKPGEKLSGEDCSAMAGESQLNLATPPSGTMSNSDAAVNGLPGDSIDAADGLLSTDDSTDVCDVGHVAVTERYSVTDAARLMQATSSSTAVTSI